MDDLIETDGWVCCNCDQPVELIAPGSWWRHIHTGEGGNACGYRLMDDAYHADTDRYYQREEDD
jgi:hypothetical protein